MSKSSVTIAVCATLLWAGTAAAAPTTQQQCDSARITAWKVYQSCVDTVAAKQAKGVDFSGYMAFAKCRHTYFTKWTTFQSKASVAGSTCIGTRFTDNSDGSVTDNLSGLVWEKKDSLYGIHQKNNLYSWSTAANNENGTAFTGFLATLNNGGGFAGANGWRLPTLAELQTIVLDFACTGAVPGPTCQCGATPCVDPALDGANTQPSLHWTSTVFLYFGASYTAWALDFSGPAAVASGKGGLLCVRAVRGGL